MGVKRPLRLLELTQLLSGRRSVPLKEIVQRFEVSERTVFRDLQDLGYRVAPITRDDQGYRLVEGATLRPLNLTAAERALLKLALDNPAIQRHAALRRPLEILEAKLDGVIAAVEETPQALRLATLDRSGPVAESIFEALDRAIREATEVEILYTSLSGATRRWRGLDPYQVFHRGEAWYVVGRCHLHDEPRTFRLDRIQDVRPLGVHFTRPRAFRLDDYLRDTWNIFRGEDPQDVVLRFHRSLAPLFEHARHHPGEEVRKLDDGDLEYRVRVSHLDEIARWVVGFGDLARVMAPAVLRARVTQIAAGALEVNSGLPGKEKPSPGRPKGKAPRSLSE